MVTHAFKHVTLTILIKSSNNLIMKFAAKALFDTSLCRQYLHVKNSLNRLEG